MSVMKGCEGGGGGVVRCGYLKKLKTSRKKFFVLRAETSEASARLEYYDSERKYNSGQPPKRSIPLKNCFNINRRLDTKHKHVIALYTKDDCFCVVLDNEEDVDSWLKALLKLQHGGEEVVDGEIPKPTFEHVWQVTVLNRGLGTSGITGNYRLCLTAKTLSLIKRDCERPTIELNLTNIRSCGSLRDFFFLEVGRSSTLGAGELWMQTEDNNIAQNVHSTVFHAMSANRSKEELGPRIRNRSSSATEASKPSNVTRKVHGNIPPKYILPQDISQSTDTQVPAGSSSQHPIVSGVASFYQHLIQRGSSKASERRHSISGSVTQSGTISHQRTQSLPLANPAPISDQNTSHPLRVAKRSNQSSKCMGGGRERCDSMPSRARTTSEGTHSVHVWNQARSHLNPYRPASLYGRDISHSPPSGSPVSPPSVGCSTDSAGSSYSLTDETDVCTELDHTLGRYSHSLTPDEAIVEEECLDSPPYTNNYIPMTLHSSDDGYVDMSPKGRHHNNSPTASLSSVTSGTPSTDMKFSDYPLEKVTSYFTSEEDNARPTRAYSVGSKPEGCHRYMDMLGQNENLRVRALSVGSKTKKMPGRVLPPHSYHPHQSTKSSSAPILSHSRGQGSHSSIGPMDDLMEMDFSRSGSINNSGYMDMTPGPKNNHGYVEMKPGRKADTSPYVDMSQGSSPAKPSFISSQPDGLGDLCNDYMDMDLRKNTHNNNNNNNNSDYLTMSFKRPSSNYQLSPAKASPLGSNYLDSQFGSPKTEPATPDGYVEMSLGRCHQRQSSLDSAQIVNDDYANMSMGKKRDRNRKKDKTRSQPIAIQNPGSNAQKMGANSSSPRYAFPGRKYSSGTPPMHLPLGETTPYSSLPRQRRRDSKDSSSSSVTTTPSNSSTIFPLSLNSPCSPVKPEKTLPQQKKTESDYTPMDFDNKSDYVNYNPKTPVNEDYAMMKPGVGVRVNSSPFQSENTSFCPTNDNKEDVPLEAAPAEPAYELLRNRASSDLGRLQSAMMRLSDLTSFRPINENNDLSEEKREHAYEILRGRPPSVSDSGRSLLSRPSSASSELCSSGSTIVGSRPESVNSDRVRPSSVSSAEVQLHYASLDLEEGNRSPRTVKGGAGEGQGGTEVTLTYAAIDFVKSEGLKHNSLTTNAKVKH